MYSQLSTSKGPYRSTQFCKNIMTTRRITRVLASGTQFLLRFLLSLKQRDNWKRQFLENGDRETGTYIWGEIWENLIDRGKRIVKEKMERRSIKINLTIAYKISMFLHVIFLYEENVFNILARCSEGIYWNGALIAKLFVQKTTWIHLPPKRRSSPASKKKKKTRCSFCNACFQTKGGIISPFEARYDTCTVQSMSSICSI